MRRPEYCFYRFAWNRRQQSGTLAIRSGVTANVGAQIRESKSLTNIEFADVGFDPDLAVITSARILCHFKVLHESHFVTMAQSALQVTLTARKIDQGAPDCFLYKPCRLLSADMIINRIAGILPPPISAAPQLAVFARK